MFDVSILIKFPTQMYNSDSSAASSSEGSTDNMVVTKELIEKMLGKEATALETLLTKVQN